VRNAFGWILFIACAVTLFLLLNKNERRHSQMALSDFRDQLFAGNVAWVTVGNDGLYGELEQALPHADTTVQAFRVELPPGTTANWNFTLWLLENRNGATIDVNNSNSLLMSILVPLIPWLLIFGFIWFFVFRQLRNAGQRPKEPLPVIVVNAGSPGAPTA
jgi:ATP-dependent Zn protease